MQTSVELALAASEAWAPEEQCKRSGTMHYINRPQTDMTWMKSMPNLAASVFVHLMYTWLAGNRWRTAAPHVPLYRPCFLLERSAGVASSATPFPSTVQHGQLVVHVVSVWRTSPLEDVTGGVPMSADLDDRTVQVPAHWHQG